MKSIETAVAGNRFEVLTEGDRFLGLGRVWIGKRLVRSGRLPLSPYTQTFNAGLELAGLKFLGIRQRGQGEVRIELEALFRHLPVKLMRDHSFDPIHETGDWYPEQITASGRLDLVLRAARDSFNGHDFRGFSYHYEYRSPDVPIFYILDRASWELDGDITGATAISQSSCSPPVAVFKRETEWTTEGILFFLVESGNQNPVMTHNLPRWASHGSFDYQYRKSDTLIGVFERVELIRSLLKREAGKPELKCFDKHIFDETTRASTSPKRILLNTDPKTENDQRNLWSWIFEDVDARARAEYDIKEEPIIPHLYQNFWHSFTVDSYYRDLLPAAINIGCKRLFLDNLKKSAMTEQAPLPGVFSWNMCCGHEYEISEKLGGVKRVKAFVEECTKHGIQPMCWTNNDQALSSPINSSERDDKGWFVRLEDTRQKYGGAYAGVMSVLDLSVPEARRYFVRSHIKIMRQTGLNCFFFDSFYNLGFMPVSYKDCRPRTIWRGLLAAVSSLQKAGINLTIESFGPWAQPCHGHPSSYDIPNIFACYRVGVGNDYTTVPTSHPLHNVQPADAAGVYYTLAHMAGAYMPLHFPDGRRIDQVWDVRHRTALSDYMTALPLMKRRYLQEDGLSVIWHDEKRERAVVFNFTRRNASLPGNVTNLSTGRRLPRSRQYQLEANQTYLVEGCRPLPTRLPA